MCLPLFNYDADGNVAKKVVADGSYVLYHYSDGSLEYEEHFNAAGTLQEVLKYFYDADGNVEYLLYKNDSFSTATAYDLYYYVRNATGDITDLFQVRAKSGSSTTVVNRLAAHYEYDPYGNILSVDTYNNDNIGNINPIRYKGYYYDLQTGWYHLGSRFYDSETGRFLNADGYASTGQGISGTNMYAYCGDNPVNRTDPSGKSWKKIKNFFKKASKKIVKFAKRMFGARFSKVSTSMDTPKIYIPNSYPITAQSGSSTTTTLSSSGNSSKLYSVSGTLETGGEGKLPSASAELSVLDIGLVYSIGADDWGISMSNKFGSMSSSFGLRINLSEVKVGLEGSLSSSKGNSTDTSYINVSANGALVVGIVAVVLMPQFAPAALQSAGI